MNIMQLKMIIYANDITIIIQTQIEIDALITIFEIYCKIINVKIN